MANAEELESEGVTNNGLWYWCDPCQFLSVVHTIPAKNRWAIKMHRASENHGKKVAKWL